MANALYTKGKQHILAGDIRLNTDDIRVTLVDVADYSVNLALHEAYSEVPAGARVASATMAGRTVTDGIFDATNTLLASVSGDPSEALVMWKNAAGVEASSWLIAYFDTATGLPVTPNGGDITIQWDDGPYKIFAI